MDRLLLEKCGREQNEKQCASAHRAADENNQPELPIAFFQPGKLPRQLCRQIIGFDRNRFIRLGDRESWSMLHLDTARARLLRAFRGSPAPSNAKAYVNPSCQTLP